MGKNFIEEGEEEEEGEGEEAALVEVSELGRMQLSAATSLS